MKSIKKIVKALALLLMLFCILFNDNQTEAASKDSTGKWLCLDLDAKNKTVTIKPSGDDISGVSSGEISIPATIKLNDVTYKVTKLQGAGWQNNKKVTKIKFTNATNLLCIGAHSFEGCTNLKSIINIDNTKVNNIGSYAFSGCSALTTNLYLPETKIKIYGSAFSGCSSMEGISAKSTTFVSVEADAFKGAGVSKKVFYVKDATAYNIVKASGCGRFTLVAMNYSVQYLGNGKNSGNVPGTVSETYGKTFSIKNATLGRIGYMFNGWNTASNGTGKHYNVGQSVSNLSATGAVVNLYAEWKPISYYIMFDKNDVTATGSMTAITATYNQAIQLPKVGFSKKGYLFDGWYCGKKYANQQSVSNLSSEQGAVVYLKAQWKPIHYTIIWHSSCQKDDTIYKETKYYDDKFMDYCHRIGYDLLGWTRKNTGEVVEYPVDKTISNLTDIDGACIDLYPVWRAIEYKICFHPCQNEENAKIIGEMKNQIMTYDKSARLLFCNYQRDGYYFAGWKDGKGNIYMNGDTVANLSNVAGTVDLYAIWEPMMYNVVFASEVGNIVGKLPSPIQCFYDKEYTIPEYSEKLFSREGYVLDGWTVNPGGGVDTAAPSGDTKGMVFYSGQKYKVNLNDGFKSEVVLHARWIEKQYKLVFNGDNEVSPMEFKYGDIVELPEIETTKTGYSFVGWNTKADGTGKMFNAGDKIYSNDMHDLTFYGTSDKIKFVMNLYPIWKAKEYRVTLIYNDAMNTRRQVRVSYDDTYKNIPIPSREGYTFRGWSTSRRNLEKLNLKSKVNITRNVYLYAFWKINNYRLELNPKGGKINNSSNIIRKTYTYLSSVKSKFDKGIPSPKRRGYVFEGWYYYKGNIKYKLVDSTRIKSNISAIAVWKKAKGQKVNVKKTSFTYNSSGPYAGKYTVKLSWNSNDALFYQYRFASDMEKIKTAKVYKTESSIYKIPGFTKNAYAYFQVRSCILDSTGRKYYGPWATIYDLGADKVKITFQRKGGKINNKRKNVTKKAVRNHKAESAFKSGKIDLKVSKKYYLFKGWKYKKDGKDTPFNKNTFVYDDVKVFAKWKRLNRPVKDQIRYVDNGDRYNATISWDADNARGYEYRYSKTVRGLRNARIRRTRKKYASITVNKNERVIFQVRAWKRDSAGNRVVSRWNRINVIKE